VEHFAIKSFIPLKLNLLHMCAEVQVSFLDKLSLRDWYKYTLYLSAILLILAVSIDVKIEQNRLVNFSVRTMIISCFVWIITETLRTAFRYYEEKKSEWSSERFTEGQKVILWIKFFADWSAFGIWAVLLVRTLL